MPADAPPRDMRTRVADTLARLEGDADAWLATGGPDGPWLVPLTFVWDGRQMWFATEARGRTVRNLNEQPRLRVALGHTRDVVMIDGDARVLPIEQADAQVVERFVRAGMDPRGWADVLIAVTPGRVQAWREANEIPGRTIMRDGRWTQGGGDRA